MSVVGQFDVVLKRLRNWVADNEQDNLLVPRDQAVVLLSGIEELRRRPRALVPDVGQDVNVVLDDEYMPSHHRGRFVRIEPAPEDTQDPTK